MTILIGIVSALAAVASLPRWRLSTFLTMLSELFVAETVIFGVLDLVALLGYWPKAYEDYQLPTYLPLATAIFVLAIFGVSHFGIVRRMMRIADPFFAARTPISIRPWPLPFFFFFFFFLKKKNPHARLLGRAFPLFRPLQGRSPMRMLSLAVFAVLALTIGAYEENGMTILIGIVSALAAVASLPRWRLSTFLTMLSELFVAETVIFGVARPRRPARLLAEGLRGLSAPDLSAARDRDLHSRHLRRLAFRHRPADDADRRPVLRRAHADLDPPLAAAADDRAAGRLRPHQRLVPDPDQPVPGRARPAVQFLPARFRQRHPGRRRGPPHGILASAPLCLRAAGLHRHPRRPRRVLRRLEFRAAMAALDDGVVHLALAHALDALQARARRVRGRQPGPAHLAGRRRLHQRQRHRHQFRQRGHLQLHDSG